MDLHTTLSRQRGHVLDCVAGLSEADLHRPVLPSGWSCLGLINHLAHDVELFWFRAVLGGQQEAIDELAVTADAWQVAPETPSDLVLEGYRRQIAHADAVIAATDPDAGLAWWPEGHFGDWRLTSRHQVLLHVITETARHAGHLDATRELIDGRQWLVQA
ncbi:DinB family protein [Catellatospora sichuanensis]|uniref:DinB family protein n=1 Tax=Catellatospora sichuanensis TaxID=1969805 RepID=UPI001182A5C5|nr:DinB family protein [Catellatospora sichuanensis]